MFTVCFFTLFPCIFLAHYPEKCSRKARRKSLRSWPPLFRGVFLKTFLYHIYSLKFLKKFFGDLNSSWWPLDPPSFFNNVLYRVPNIVPTTCVIMYLIKCYIVWTCLSYRWEKLRENTDKPKRYVFLSYKYYYV